QYVLGRRRLQPAIDRLTARPAPAATATRAPGEPLTAQDLRRTAAVLVFFLFASFFWGAYEQAGSTLNLFADRYVHLELLGIKLYASWFVSIQAAFVILLSPIFAWLWVKLGPRQPSSPAKFALALLFVGLAFVLLMPAGAIAQGGVKISPLWLVAVYFIEELGELCLSPVGLSVVTKLAPKQVVGLMMGVFFLSNALGNKLAGSSAAAAWRWCFWPTTRAMTVSSPSRYSARRSPPRSAQKGSCERSRSPQSSTIPTSCRCMTLAPLPTCCITSCRTSRESPCGSASTMKPSCRWTTR